jgi:hypothetical protein
MPLDFTNLTRSPCTLYGFPGVSAIGFNGKQQGSPATWDHSLATPATVRVDPGGTAHAWLVYRGGLVGGCPAGYHQTAYELRVYPPDQNQQDLALWDFATCTAQGYTQFLMVSAIAPGPGNYLHLPA